MNVITSFLAGVALGAIIGTLIYRNNAKKIEREAKEQLISLKRELNRMKRLTSQMRK